MSCVLRAGGRDFDVDRFLADSSLAVRNVWHRGKKRFRRRPPSEDSGCTIDVSDASYDDLPSQIDDAIRFLDENRGELRRLRDAPGFESSYLDFALHSRMANPNVFGHYDHLPAKLIRLAAEFGMGIELSQYPSLHRRTAGIGARRADARLVDTEASFFLIVPGVGLGPLRFGMTVQQVHSVLGSWYEQDTRENGDVWFYYHDLNLTIEFHAAEGHRLCEIDIRGPSDVTFAGVRVFDKRKPELLELFSAFGPFDHDGEPTRLAVDKIVELWESDDGVLDFWFLSTGELKNIDLYPRVDEAIDEYVWPSPE